MSRKKTVERLLEEDSLKTKSDYFKQYAILKNLEKKYPNKNFWAVFKIKEKLTSLYFFKTSYGDGILKKRYKEFLYRPPKKDLSLNLNQAKGEDVISSRRRRTIKNFLND